MQTDLAYIDDVADMAVNARLTKASQISSANRDDIRSKAHRTVAGFKVFDEDAEKRLLDEQIARQKRAVDAFIADRGEMRDRLGAAGITPLAVLPSLAWERICVAADLFRLYPNAEGRVGFDKAAFDGFKKPKNRYMSDPLDRVAWLHVLRAMFPKHESLTTERSRYAFEASPCLADLVLPEPPQDVVDILLLADKGKIMMRTAAVAEAIQFRQSRHELRDRNEKHQAAETRRIDALKADPIIYTEHKSVTAIIAQFGDFPIEKEVVDRVVEADDFIPDHPTGIEPSLYGISGTALGDNINVYTQAMQMQNGQSLSRLQIEHQVTQLLGQNFRF